MSENKEQVIASKKWSEMSAEEKLKAMPEYKENVSKKITEYKQKLADERRKLKQLENEEKALKYEVLEQKAKDAGKSIDDLI